MNQSASRINAGISTTVTKKMMKIRVSTRARGKSHAYAPSTPAMAPLAPMVGAVDPGSISACV